MRLTTAPALAAGGDAVARAPDGRVVFISGAAPEEEVEVAIDEDHRRFLRAHVVRVITPSPHRRAAPCPYFDATPGGARDAPAAAATACGGCTLQHVAHDAQVRSKHEAVLETLARIGRVDRGAVHVAQPWHGDAEGYRGRARFAVALGERGDRRVGFRAARRREVVDVARCVVLAPPLQRALERVRAAVQALPASRRHPRELELDVVAAGDVAAVALPDELPALAGVFREDPQVRLAREPGDTLLDDDGARGPLRVHPAVFAQGNPDGNRAMVDEVEALVVEATRRPDGTLGALGALVELYSGSGNFTRRLALLAHRVRAFEQSAEATALARSILPPSVELLASSAEDAVAQLLAEGAAIELLVLDPPRAGLSEAVVAGIARLRPAVIVYVSCDPATFARDVGRLQAAGAAALDHLRVFDLYPHTAHVEVIGRLTRSNP